MIDNVVKLYPHNAASNPDAVLEQAVGAYSQIFLIGYDKNDNLDVRASTNFKMREILFALEVFKFKILNGEYEMQLSGGDA